MTQDPNRTTRPYAGRFRCTMLMAALLAAGCEVSPHRNALFEGTEVHKQGPTTIGELARRDIRLQKQTLTPAPPEEVLATYKKALALFSTADQRSLAMRRMADLTMLASEDTLGPGLSDDASPGVRTGGGLKDATYEKAIRLYLEQIDSAPPGTDLAETLYLLAKAYDMNGQPDEALATLDRLSRDYPGSNIRDEVEFRRGEQYFTLARYDEAEQAYKAVIAYGEKGAFYENALYKFGWSLYKQGNYQASIDPFMSLLDRYLPPPPPSARPKVNPAAAERLAEFKAATPKLEPPPEGDVIDLPVKAETKKELTAKEKARQQMQEDTLRAVALAFSNIDGPRAMPRYLREKGERHYSYELYEALAKLYIFQERYRDAAEAYGTYVDQHPFHPMAPGLSSKKIEVYTKGGFPSLVLEEKRHFVEQYGVYSSFWKRATPAVRNGYVDELKRHMMELAQHYHAKAQSAKTPAAYKEASRWYREYLAGFPKDDNAALMNSLLGETLFAAEQFREAIDEFERATYDYKNAPNAQKSGYFGLLAYEEYLKRLPKTDPTRRAWITRSVTATLRFLKQWPEDEHQAELYENILDNQLGLDDLKAAEATAASIIKRVPPVPAALKEKAWIVMANAQFDQKNYTLAEKSYKKVLEFPSLSAAERSLFAERRATSIYKQAETLEKEGMKDQAASVFLKAAQSQPDADVSAKAEYDAANLLMETGKYKDAVAVLEKFRERYPDHKLTATIPAKLSVAYEKLGDDEGSARELERVASAQSDNKELGHQALQQAAALHERKGNKQEALRLFKQLEADKDTPFAERVELRYKIAGLNDALGNARERDAWRESILEAYDKGGANNTPRTRFLAAEISFQKTEPLYQDYAKIRLSQPLAASIKQKKQAMSAVVDAYKRTADIGVLQYTTAANYKMGEVYHDFAKAIMGSERPAGLADDALEEYELILEDQSAPLNDQAISLHETNIQRIRSGAWDEWIQRSYDALGELQPGRYRKPEQEEVYADDIL